MTEDERIYREVALGWSRETGIISLEIEKALHKLGPSGARRAIDLALATHVPLQAAFDELSKARH